MEKPRDMSVMLTTERQLLKLQGSQRNTPGFAARR